MGKVISIVNHKGGVGKTTTTLNLGKALSLQQKRVLIVDLDPQANLSQSLGIEEPIKNIYHTICENQELPVIPVSDYLYVVPADLDLSEADIRLQTDVNGYFKLKNALKSHIQAYDYILIDCPPSLGILTINALIASKELIIVVQSQYLAIKGLQTIIELVKRLRENLNSELEINGLLLTQINRTVFSRSIEETVRNVYQGKVFTSAIRQNVSLAEASSAGKDIFTYSPKSSGAEDYYNLAKEVIDNG